MKRLMFLALLCAVCALRPMFAAPPAFVDITWMSISNMYYELGPLNIVTDGYITRLPQDAFFGGGGGYAQTRRPFAPDVAAVTRVMNALSRPTRVNLLLTGHSHWDHSFDTATWRSFTQPSASSARERSTCRSFTGRRMSARLFSRRTPSLWAAGTRRACWRCGASGDCPRS